MTSNEKYSLSSDDKQFIESNSDFFKLVIELNQPVQYGHDIAKRVVDIYTNITKLELDKNCPNCIKDAFIIVKTEYNKQFYPKPKK